MPLSDEDLIDFNARLLIDYSDEKAHADLEEYGDVFRVQLIEALHLSAWADSLAEGEHPALASLNVEVVQGWINALREVAAHLRQGNYLPGGTFYEATVNPPDENSSERRTSHDW